jgi:hypothetical protein
MTAVSLPFTNHSLSMKTCIILFSLASVFFIGCGTCSQCHLTASHDFKKSQSLTLLILPVTTNGNPNIHVLPNLSDDFATPFMEAGYKVVDRSAAQSEAIKLGLDLDKGIEDKNVPALALSLHVDAILLSSAAYTFIPAESGIIPSTYNKVADSTGKVREVSVKGPEEYNRSEHYSLTSLSARLIDARNMSTMLSAYIEPCGGKSVNARLVEMLQEKLSGKD